MTWRERLEQEYFELVDKTNKLEAYLASSTKVIDSREHGLLLVIQLEAMKTYKSVLEARLRL